MQISGKVVVITGASMGIGEALTREFATKGALVVMSSRGVGRVEEARMRVGIPEQTTALACDVTDRGQVQNLVGEVVKRFGRIDVWVNNAGFGLLDSVANMDLNDCRAMFETNLFGAISCMQGVLPQMKAQRAGAIINVSSVAGHIPVPYMAAYCATKHAMNAIGKAARVELKGTGVNVLTVCPGRVRTNFSANTIRGGEGRRMGDALNRGISAERVARAVVHGYVAGKREIVVPWSNRIFISLYRAAPGLIEFAMARMMGATTQRSESQ